jgi:hypothetical protein
MPARLMLWFVLITPFAGIVQVENGSYGPSVNRWGHSNGAWLAFLVYAAFLLLAAHVASGGWIFRRLVAADPPRLTVTSLELRRFMVVALTINATLVALMLVAFGGLSVLSGDVGKGEFRASLGGLGAVAYLTLKWLAPSTFAMGCALHVFSGRPRRSRWMVFLLGFLTFVIGVAWGFKTSGILALVPGITVLFWHSHVRKLFWLGCFSLVAIVLAALAFDFAPGSGLEAVFTFLWARLTVWQGDVAWHIWDMWRDGEAFPNYWVTPLVAVGDQLYSALTGLTRDSGEQWVMTHFGAMLTYLAGNPIDHIIYDGHNVTGTPFSEGVIALGAAGIPVFGTLAGLVCGFVFRKINGAIQTGRPLASALWSNYFCWCVFAWLNGGDIVQLFHISVIVGAIAAWLMLSVFMASARLPRHAIAPAPGR